MDFVDFLKYIPQIEKETLLATKAHLIMAPAERVEQMKNFSLEGKNPKQAAVMMLFYPKNDKTHLVLIVRNSYPGVHSSQIAFPGGKVESYDLSVAHAALRETHEEIGVNPNQISIIRAFTALYIPPSNFMVYPFLGYSTEELDFQPDPNEVSGIIELSLHDFLDEKRVVSKRMSTSYSDDIEVPAFKIQEHFVWGATAMMLSELKEAIKNIL
jgi:8-oxo-dGTP pyrophosphatase MutT (NUDIX family)